MKRAQTDQIDLFWWAENRPSNVIDGRARFEAKVADWLIRMIETNQMPPKIEGKVIKLGRTAA